MTGRDEIRGAAFYSLIMLAKFFPFQAIVILIHEFTRSITAYLPGAMPGPLRIVSSGLIMKPEDA